MEVYASPGAKSAFDDQRGITYEAPSDFIISCKPNQHQPNMAGTHLKSKQVQGEKMLERRSEDALVKLVKTVETVETVKTVETVETVETVVKL